MTIHAPNIADHYAALTAALAPLPVYEYGRVPGMKRDDGHGSNPGQTPASYGLLQVERVYLESATAARLSRRTSWRASLRAVGKSPADCKAALSALGAVENARLTIDARTSTPVAHESSEAPAPDDGWHSALVRFTYSL